MNNQTDIIPQIHRQISIGGDTDTPFIIPHWKLGLAVMVSEGWDANQIAKLLEVPDQYKEAFNALEIFNPTMRELMDVDYFYIPKKATEWKKYNASNGRTFESCDFNIAQAKMRFIRSGRKISPESLIEDLERKGE